ncbi:hypothetical protein [Actibacterium pelagium]|uniref:Uncharacterized protein n=1 Tax=Actibacterium pelagium TaxID=2029103 RepID=A0A917AIZ8_9RHOB|nr:hypothetical protein [Actibacterium pelagium]GGE56500.1 hypothetical protein GCM10011517_25300 [Actibacterium pelagium]
MTRHHLVLLLILLFPLSAFAEGRELHVVAARQGIGPSRPDLPPPTAQVLIDRPGSSVVLVLLDSSPIEWSVTATPGTIIENILLGGEETSNSQVLFFGTPFVGNATPGIPMTHHPQGEKFRALITHLTDRMGTERISSFQGVQVAPKGGFVVDRVDTNTTVLSRDYLADLVADTHDLPKALRDWLGGKNKPPVYDLRFEENGMYLTVGEDTRVFPVDPRLPTPVFPSGSAFDVENGVIYGITFGGEGFIYSVDTKTGEWSIIDSLNGYDAMKLYYHAPERQLIMTGAFSRPGEIRVYDLDGGVRHSKILVNAFPGLTDIFNYGNEHAPSLIPKTYEEDWLLLEANSDDENPATRVYAVHLTTQEVRLLRFTNP